ncbi:MAG TPA: ATP-binding protein, partial [Planctomycetaceae bacterium]
RGRSLLAGMALDVTERKRIEEAVRQSQARFEALFDAAPIGAYLVDADLRIRLVNPKARPVFGDIDPLIGRGFAEVVRLVWPPALADEVVGRFRHTLATGEPYFVPEVAEERLDRKVREYYEWHVSRIALPDGGFGVVCYFNDISRHVLAREALADADRRKTEFLATLGHELRNPLAPIRTGLELVKLAGDDPAVVGETLGTMERQVGQMVRLIDDLLDVSRITQGKLRLRTCRVALADVVRDAVEAARPVIDEAGHDLAVTLPEGPVHLDADPARLAQVISNLLNNAAKYTPEGGRIRLSAERQGGDAVVAVRDDGIGIPAGMLDRIFEMFAQIDRQMETGYKGLGIGLTLVKRLVEMHDGTVEVRSEGEGLGSEFCVRLPVVVEPSADMPQAGPDIVGLGGGGLRILVVDDNRAAADLLGKIVRMLGNEVRTAYDGEQAVKAAAEFLPEVVLMDLGMPKMDGYQAAREIRRRPWGEGVFLVALTGWGQEEDRMRTQEAGFDRHLVKPAEPAALRALFDEVRSVRT